MNHDNLFHALIAAATDGILVIDVNGRIQVFNAACERMFGYLSKEAVGKNIKMLMPSPFKQEHDSYIARYLATGEKRIIGIGREVVGRRKDRSTFPLFLSVGEGKNAGERFFVGILRDLTSQKAVAKDLLAHQNQLLAMFSSGPDLVVQIDDNYKITSFGPEAKRIFGYADNEVIGKDVKVLLPSPNHRHQNFLTVPSISGDGVRHELGSRLVIGQRKSGASFPIEISVGEAIQGSRRQFRLFIKDLALHAGAAQHLNDMQAELVHATRLTAMGQMTAAIAHELKQPLSAIANFANAAIRTLKSARVSESAVATAIGILDKAVAQTVRADRILKNLREFGSKREGDRTVENLNVLVEDAIALSFIGAGSHSIKVAFKLDLTLPPVIIERVQIEQVLVNLLRNAIEAMQTAKVKKLVVTTSRGTAGFANVTIQDSGPGLPGKVVRDLFQPFVTTKESGMGIGLTICQTLVEAHGGHVWLVKSSHAGTTFSFSVPLAVERR